MNILTLKKTLSLLLEAQNKTKSRLGKYLDLQDSPLLVNFSDDEETMRNEYSKLKSFTLKFVSDIENADTYIAKLSTYICQSDSEMNNSTTLLLITIFDRYTSWRSSAKNFIIKSENIIENNDQNKYSLLFSEARSLYCATDSLCCFLNNELLKISV